MIRKYKQRLWKRPSNPNIVHIMKMKEDNARKVINIARQVKTPPWSMEEMKKVLKTLKNNKCRDPCGLINELFRPGVIGAHLQVALLDLFNNCKSHMQVPDFMQ